MQEPYAGPLFVNAEWPYGNSLASGITGAPPASLYGTDPAGYARQTASAWEEQVAKPRLTIPGVPIIGGLLPAPENVVGFIVGLLVLAFGLWVVVKQ